MSRRSNLKLVTVEQPTVPANSDELERIFQAHSGLVFRTAYRVTGNASDAEDILQSVFLRLMRRAAEAPVLENEESYFRRAAINVSLDVVRARAAERQVPLHDLESEPVRQDCGDLRASLRAAIGRLKPQDAEIFTLRFIEEIPNQEIARMLGISQILVAVRVHRIRRQLQKEIRTQ